jgi:leader peptidase (prepilin peptidase)/N-methyltransferase
VVIYRVPAGKSIVQARVNLRLRPPIAWYDNIPVLSWLILGGRARCCGQALFLPLPLRGAPDRRLFLVCWLRLPPAAAVCGWVFLGSLISATFIDLDHMIIPDVFTIGLAIAGLILSALVPSLHGQHGEFYVAGQPALGSAALVGIVAGSGVVLWIALTAEAALKKEAMGFGDVKFVGAIGAFCGWHGAVFSIFGGAAVGTVWMGRPSSGRRSRASRGPVRPGRRPPRARPRTWALACTCPLGRCWRSPAPSTSSS